MIRPTVVWQVMWVKVDGSNVLEGPYYYDWKRIPVVRCPGRYVNIEGRKKFQSLIRHSKDAQRSYNSRASDMIERSALLPKAPYLVTETMIKGYEDGVEPSQRTVPAVLAVQRGQERARDYAAPHGAAGSAAGRHGARADVHSGHPGHHRVLRPGARQRRGHEPRIGQGARAAHEAARTWAASSSLTAFSDALQLTWEMLIDMIPTVYDSERVERIIGHDGIEKLVTINGRRTAPTTSSTTSPRGRTTLRSPSARRSRPPVRKRSTR